MIELYFIFYRIPKMMSRDARERGRSALAWSLIGIAAWIGAEVVVGLSLGIFYAAGVLLWGWPENEPPLFSLLSYVAALAAALGGLALVRRILYAKTMDNPFAAPPPPPPSF
jgi:uncharacterized protein YneF (UPF0154 family)